MVAGRERRPAMAGRAKEVLIILTKHYPYDIVADIQIYQALRRNCLPQQCHLRDCSVYPQEQRKTAARLAVFLFAEPPTVQDFRRE